MPRARTISIYLLICETGGGRDDSFGARMHNLVQYIQEAVDYAENDAIPPRNNLNVFMAPEFYLNRGASVLPEAQWRQMVTSMLRHSNAHPEWVLIPGTALWEYRWAQPTSFQRQNTAPVFHGGQLVHAYCKKYPGDTELAVGTAWSTDYPLGNVPSDPVFEIDGVHFGIDICNDYRRGAFARYFDKTGAPAFGPGLPPWVAQYNAKPGVDVHLLTASGVSPMSARTYLPLENAAP